MTEMRTVFFDLDGVLLDTEPLYRRFWKEAANKCAYELSDEEALSLRSLDGTLARAWEWIAAARPVPKGMRASIDIDAFNLV